MKTHFHTSIIAAALLAASPVLAEADVLVDPVADTHCQQITGQPYPVGDDDAVEQMIETHCWDADGRYSRYVSTTDPRSPIFIRTSGLTQLEYHYSFRIRN